MCAESITISNPNLIPAITPGKGDSHREKMRYDILRGAVRALQKTRMFQIQNYPDPDHSQLNEKEPL